MLKFNESMAKHTSFKCGGKAKTYFEPENLQQFLSFIKKHPNSFILGNGTNVLFSDNGFNGTVVCTKNLNNLKIRRCKKHVFVWSEAGIMLAKLNSILAKNCAKGMEWSYGIPGSVGGAVFMNAGAFGGEIYNHIVSVTVFKDGVVKTLKKSEINYSYRDGGLKNCVILSAKFKFEYGNCAEILSKQQQFMEKRKKSQDLAYPSAGSIFKRQSNLIPAEIIDKLGLKGVIIGKAKVSEKHAGFIVNIGGASAADVINLISLVKNRVKESTGRELETEIIIVGDL